MEAKDKLWMDCGFLCQTKDVSSCPLPTEEVEICFNSLRFQALQYEAGIREVVEDMTSLLDNANLGHRLGAIERCLERWQAKLKKWGVK